MHLGMGGQEYHGAHGPIWLETTLCNKLLKTDARVTKNRDRVTCAKCLREMRKADAFMRWIGTGDAQDFAEAHGFKADVITVGGNSAGVRAEKKEARRHGIRSA